MICGAPQSDLTTFGNGNPDYARHEVCGGLKKLGWDTTASVNGETPNLTTETHFIYLLLSPIIISQVPSPRSTTIHVALDTMTTLGVNHFFARIFPHASPIGLFTVELSYCSHGSILRVQQRHR